MKKHKDAIQKLKTTIRALAIEGRETRAEIRELKNEPNSGPVRHRMKVDYDFYVRPKVRNTLLAYGFLRGRPYQSMEAKCSEAPSAYGIHKAIQKALGDDEEAKVEWTLDHIRTLLSKAPEAKEAA